MRPLILLTATVTPSFFADVALRDPGARLAQYQESLAWWISSSHTLGVDLAIAENSGSSLASWVPPSVTAISLPQQAESARGKGIGEVEMLLSAAAREEVKWGDRPWIGKCTGRLTLRNPSEVTPRQDLSDDFVSCRINGTLDQVDARLVFASPQIWTNYLLSQTADMNDSQGVYFEHVLARGLHRAMSEGVAFVPFSRVPRFLGTSGTSGLRYDSVRMRAAATLEDAMSLARIFGARSLSRR
jgi:hypothetical protein